MTSSVKWIVGFSLGLSIIFCASFAFFYSRVQKELHSQTSLTPIGKPLPEAHLVDRHLVKIDDQAYRKGKTILIFVTPNCEACKVEGQFLTMAINRRDDVKFFGVVSFGEKKTSLELAEKLFPFRVFYDEGFHLAGKLGITRVPIKIFLEDGIIRKAWGGATRDEEGKQAFLRWLDGLH